MEVGLRAHFNISMASETRCNSQMLYFTSIYTRKGAANEMGPRTEDNGEQRSAGQLLRAV